MDVQVEIPGLKCQSCVDKIKKYLKEKYPDLLNYDDPDSIEVDFEQKILIFHLKNLIYTPGTLKKFIDSIENGKYSCKILSPLDNIVNSMESDSSTDPLLGKKSYNEKKQPIVVPSAMINERPGNLPSTSNDQERRKCFISIQGMSCTSCVEKIEKQLKQCPGILSCQIGLITARAEIDFKPNLITPKQIVDIVDDMGFTVELISVIDQHSKQLSFDIMGISSEQEAREIERKISELFGIISVQVISDTGRAIITHYPDVIGPRFISDKIQELGFTVHTVNSFDPEKFTEGLKKEAAKWRQSFFISLIFGVPTMLSMIYFMYIMPSLYHGNENELRHHRCCVLVNGLSLENLILVCLATPVQVFGARYFYIQAFRSLRSCHLSMDVLIMLATTIAYVYSIGVLIYFIVTNQPQSPMTFLDTPPMLLLFISLGRWLEHKNRLSTTEYIVNLMSLRPSKATLLEVEKRPGQADFLVIKTERNIEIELVEKGDYLRVRPGERVPTDGRMVMGTAMVDESFINGESMPKKKIPGSFLLGGSIVSNGTVVMEATNVGADSQLCQIVKMVENAQTTKAPIQQLADRIASYFIPFVIITSVLAFASWLWLGPILFERIVALNPVFYTGMSRTEIVVQFAFQIALSVMIISCPCALGIATPSAVIIGTGIGAINGIHIKGAEPLERAQNLDAIIFDKTGTLTHGKLSVVYIQMLCNRKIRPPQFIIHLLTVIGMAEANSDHPIAVSVVNFVRKALLLDDDCSFGQLDDEFKMESGLGIECIINRQKLESFVSTLNTEMILSHIGKNTRIVDSCNLDETGKEMKNNDTRLLSDSDTFKIVIGNLKWMIRNNISFDPEEINENKYSCEDTEIFVGIKGFKKMNDQEGELVCRIPVYDTIKPEALLTVYSLRKLFGLDVLLLSGDNIFPAASIGRQVGIRHIYAGLLPQHKMDKIKHLQSMGKSIAMVGDGINDAPALAQANLGIAIAKGTDITIESADVVLTKDDLLDIVACIDLSRKTMDRIRINFLLAFLYNVTFIPIAAGIFINFGLILQPWMSGACMALSSISVSCSSLLLRRYRKPTRKELETEEFLQYKKNLELYTQKVNSVYHDDNLSLHSPENLIQNGVPLREIIRQSDRRLRIEIRPKYFKMLMDNGSGLPSRSDDIELEMQV